MSPWHLSAIFSGIQEGIFHGRKNKNHGWVLSTDDPGSNVGRFLADFLLQMIMVFPVSSVQWEKY